MKLGVLGGTFDPVHKGHLGLAEAARRQLGLDEVLFVPAGLPQLKGEPTVATAAHRLEMLRLAVAGKPHYRVSTMELERGGPTYTYDTILELCHGLGEATELYFIMGWDILPMLPRWQNPAGLVELCTLVVAPRPGYAKPKLKPLAKLIPGLADRVVFLEEPMADISASEVRERVARGLPVRHLVPAAVSRYIKDNRLYAAENGGR